jgi:hypothetical protein
LLICPLLPSLGCSAYIALSGKNLNELKTQSEVQATFGEPLATGQIDGKPFAEYTTRQKIAEPWKGMGLCMGWVMTLGFGELFFFPHELYVAGRRTLVGQKLQFVYDEAGNVTSIQLDGDHLPWSPQPSERASPELPVIPQALPDQ